MEGRKEGKKESKEWEGKGRANPTKLASTPTNQNPPSQPRHVVVVTKGGGLQNTSD